MNFLRSASTQKLLRKSIKNKGLGSFEKDKIFFGTIETIGKFKIVAHQECNLLYKTKDGYVYFKKEKMILIKTNDSCRIINLVPIENYIPINDIYSYTYQNQEFLVTKDCFPLEKYNQDYNL